MIRVLLADDHTIVRQGVRLCLEAMGDIEVVAEAEDGQEAVQLASQLRPDVAVVDLTMPRLNGVEAIRQIKRDVPDTEVVVLSVHDSEAYVVQALRAGAAGLRLEAQRGDRASRGHPRRARRPGVPAPGDRAAGDRRLPVAHPRVRGCRSPSRTSG